MQDDSPKDYFLKALLGHGIKINPVAFNDPRSKIMCVALKYLTTDELPQMYDKALLSLMYEGSLEDIRSRVAPEGRSIPNLANAQNVNGETVLMKVCRRALSTNRHSPLAVVGLLLKSGANPMVCCDSGKNVLHDVFWSAKPPPPDVLKAMEKMVDMIHECTGRTGLLELMLSEDKHGYTPLDYVVPAQQPNWRTIVDTVVSWAACDSQDSGLSGPSDAIKDVELDAIACCDHASPLSMSTRTETRLIQSLSDRIISNLRLVTADGMTITDFMRDMDATDVRVIAQLCT